MKQNHASVCTGKKAVCYLCRDAGRPSNHLWALCKHYIEKAMARLKKNTVNVISCLSNDNEPEEWTLEETHAKAHHRGAPGIYALSPQSKKKVYFDNLLVYPNP